MLSLNSVKQSQGFSLIELVTVMMIIGIVMVVAVPRVLTNDEVSSYATQSQLVSALRSTQLMAMNNTDRCYRFQVNDKQYQVFHYSGRSNGRCTGTIERRERSHTLSNSIRLLVGNQTQFSLDFNHDGQAFYQDSTQCPQQCLAILGTPSTQIMIESEGYIHGQ